MLYTSPYNSFNDKNTTDEQRVTYCKLLRQEYRGDKVLIDDENIDAKYRLLVNTGKIKACAIYVPIVKAFTDEENNNYDNGVIRQFHFKNGKKIPKKALQYIEDLYTQSQYNLNAIQWEHEAGLYGTVIVRPAFDERTGLLGWIRLTPDDSSLKVSVDGKFSNVAKQIIYTTDSDDGSVEHVWDWHTYKVYKLAKDGKRENVAPLIDIEHNFKETEIADGGMPWTTLRYSVDNRNFWGPFDGGMASLSMFRSFMLADSVHRTQTSLFEILVMAGYSEVEAIAAVQSMKSGKVMIAKKGVKSDEGDAYDQDPHYISPQGMEPGKVLDIYMRVFEYIRQMRGHAKKNFEVGADVQSFEAQRLAEGVLRRRQLQNRPYLLSAEQRNLKLLIQVNNQTPGNPKIPEDIEVTIDWTDPTRFSNMKDFVEYSTVCVNKNWMTNAQVLKMINPDLTEDQAKEKYEENKKINEEDKVSNNEVQPPQVDEIVDKDAEADNT